MLANGFKCVSVKESADDKESKDSKGCKHASFDEDAWGDGLESKEGVGAMLGNDVNIACCSFWPNHILLHCHFVWLRIYQRSFHGLASGN